MASRNVIGLPPVTMSLVTLYNCFLTVEDYTNDTQKFQAHSYHTDVVRGGSLSTRDARRLCNYLLSYKVPFSPMKVFTGRNFEARKLRVLHLEAYLYLHNSLSFIFSIRKFKKFVFRLWTFSKKISFFLILK